MSIAAIPDVLSAVAPLSRPDAAVPSAFAQERFAALLNDKTAVGSPDTLLAVQKDLTSTIVSTELAAKGIGLLTQSVNKLVNMQ